MIFGHSSSGPKLLLDISHLNTMFVVNRSKQTKVTERKQILLKATVTLSHINHKLRPDISYAHTKLGVNQLKQT